MGLIEETIDFVINGSIAGLPPLVVMILPLVLGLIVGFFARKVLKVVVVAAIVIVVAAFFGLFALDLASLPELAQQLGSMALTYGALLLGVLPLTTGFIIGAIIGFILS